MDKIFVEGVDIVSDSGDGYNSTDHGYKTFDVIGVNTAIGLDNGATVSYSISGISSAGIYKASFGSVILDSNLVKYKINFKKDNSNLFSKGELLNFGSSEKHPDLLLITKDGTRIHLN